MMNRKTPYGHFPPHVQSMQKALQRWSSPDFIIADLIGEERVFGEDFPCLSIDVFRMKFWIRQQQLLFSRLSVLNV